MEADNNSFDVWTLTTEDKYNSKYVHWAKNLTMTIKKDGVTIELNSDEIQQMVKTLPKTVGGIY